MSQAESSVQKEAPTTPDSSAPPQARMVDLWMSARRDLREVIPPSKESKVEALRASLSVNVQKPSESGTLPIAPPPVQPSAIPSKPPTLPTSSGPMPPAMKKFSPSGPNVPAQRGGAPSKKLQVFKTALSVAQKMLPLLEGNVGMTVSNLLSLGSPSAASSRDIAAVEDRLTRLHVTNQALSESVAEQKEAIVQISDRLDQLKEATNRNTLEQQELMADARTFRRKFVVAGAIIIGLLMASVALNIIVLLKLAH